MTASEVRRIVKATAPGIRFSVRKVGFVDLARDEAFSIDLEGASSEVYDAVRAAAPAGSFVRRNSSLRF